MSIDARRAIRRVKPERRTAQLAPRPLADLVAAQDVAGIGRVALVPDTCVYIDAAAGRLPGAADELVTRGLLFHCSVCVGELMTGVANFHPRAPGWRPMRDHYLDLVEAMPSTRMLDPDAETWAEAGLIAGTLARTQGFQPHQRRECLNDALILLTAAKAGLPVLTANREEYDLIQQLAPQGRFVCY